MSKISNLEKFLNKLGDKEINSSAVKVRKSIEEEKLADEAASSEFNAKNKFITQYYEKNIVNKIK